MPDGAEPDRHRLVDRRGQGARRAERAAEESGVTDARVVPGERQDDRAEHEREQETRGEPHQPLAGRGTREPWLQADRRQRHLRPLRW